MRLHAIRTSAIVVAILLLPFLYLAAQQTSSLVIEGPLGRASVIQVQGRNLVEVEELARITGGSLRFTRTQIVLTLPGTSDASSQVSESMPTQYKRAPLLE